MQKSKFLIVDIDKKYLLVFRITMFLASIPFIVNIYDTIVNEMAISGKYIYPKENWGYYAYLFKELAFSFLFLWLATFGSREKDGSR